MANIRRIEHRTGGLIPYVGHTGMCCPKGKVFRGFGNNWGIDFGHMGFLFGTLVYFFFSNFLVRSLFL